MNAKLKVIVLIGGSGSNLQRLIDLQNQNKLDIEIQAVISHSPTAYGLERAEIANISAICIDHRVFENRNQFENQLASCINNYHSELIILAGFMRILSPEFVQRYLGKIINIHPSRLPLFKGLNTHAAALAAGQTIHGASVHFVTADLDGGPIIAQSTVNILKNDTASSLKEKVQATEYILYPTVIQWFAEKRLSLKKNGVYLDNQLLPSEGMQ